MVAYLSGSDFAFMTKEALACCAPSHSADGDAEEMGSTYTPT